MAEARPLGVRKDPPLDKNAHPMRHERTSAVTIHSQSGGGDVAAMGGFSDPAGQTAARRPWRPRAPSKETRMPDDVGLLSVVPIGVLVFGGIVAAIVVAVFATVIVKGIGGATMRRLS